MEPKIKITSIAHFLGGLITSLISFINPVLSVMLFLGFIIYELDEDWHISDEAFRDILEFMIGMYLGALASAVLHHMFLG